MLTINTKIAKYMASLSMALLTKRNFTSTSNYMLYYCCKLGILVQKKHKSNISCT